MTRARQLVMEWDQIAVDRRGRPISGERKRRQVLNQLVSEFPSARVRDLAFTIERVIQER